MRLAPSAILVGALCVGGLAGCGTSDDATAPGQAAAVPAPPEPVPTPPTAGMNENCELALYFRQEFEKLRERFGEKDPVVTTARELAESTEAKCSGTAASVGPNSGEWVQKDGVLTCVGYLTRRDDQDYCSAEVPDDWVPFEYEGEIYFLQPLTGNAGRSPGT